MENQPTQRRKKARKRGRKGRPWYREYNDSWYVKRGGKCIKLATGKENEDEALRKWHELEALWNAPDLGQENLLKAVFELHLTQLKCGPDNHRARTYFLQSFVDRWPGLTVRELRPSHVDEWIAEKEWAESSAWAANMHLQAALNWAARKDLIHKNPVKGMARPSPRSRGSESLIEPEHSERLIDAAKPEVRDVLIMLRETGARPSELFRVEAKDYQAGRGVIVVERHKTAGKTHRPRLIYIPATGPALEILDRLCKLYPAGPIFRRATGGLWYTGLFCKRIWSLRRRLGLPATVRSYGYRHTFATDGLASGLPDTHVAELLGQTSTKMLHRHYSHLDARGAVLRSGLNSIRGDAGKPAPKESA